MPSPVAAVTHNDVIEVTGSEITGINIGPAEADRRVVVHFITPSLPTSATMGGVTLDIHQSFQFQFAFAGYWVHMASAVVPTGTTADLAVTGGGGELTITLAWAITGAATTPNAFAGVVGSSGTGYDTTINCGINSITIAEGADYQPDNVQVAHTWTGLDEVFDQAAGQSWNLSRTGADRFFATAVTGHTVGYVNDTALSGQNLYLLVGNFTGPEETIAEVDVTGVQATGAVGTATATGDASAPVTGLAADGETGTVTVLSNMNFPVTGVAGTGQVGTATVGIGVHVEVTGETAQGEVGSVTTGQGTTVDLSGVSANGVVGTVDAGVVVSVTVTGVEATGETGTAQVNVAWSEAVTGVEGTGEVGNVEVNGAAIVDVSGLEATASVGSVEVIISAVKAYPVGEEAQAALGSVTVTGTAVAPVTGIAVNGQLGNPTIFIPTSFTVNGIVGVTQIGPEEVIGEAIEFVDMIGMRGLVNSVEIDNDYAQGVTGFEGVGGVGDVQIGRWAEVISGSPEIWSKVII